MNRTRRTNDLEVIIKSDNELIGWISSIDASRLRRPRVIAFNLATGEEDDEMLKVSISHTYMTGTATYRVDIGVIEKGVDPVADLVPNYADILDDSANDQIVFTWAALMIDDAWREAIFDHPDFIPA